MKNLMNLALTAAVAIGLTAGLAAADDKKHADKKHAGEKHEDKHDDQRKDEKKKKDH